MIIGIIGTIGSGKNTAANTLVQQYGYCQESFAKSLKDACSHIFNWPRELLEGDTAESRSWRECVDTWWSEKLGIDNFTPRYALQYIGTDVLRDKLSPDIWFLSLENRIRKNPNLNFVISDVRFINEANFIKSIGGKLIRICRGQPEWVNLAKAASLGDMHSIDKLRELNIHSSEWELVNFGTDYYIENDGSIHDLESKIRLVMQDIA